MRRPLWLVAIAGVLAACGSNSHRAQSARVDCITITAANTDDCVRLNEIQLLGTHNSYHIAPEAPMLAALGERARNIEYTHRPLDEQLSQLGIRKFEVDVFADPEGGRYATPAAFRIGRSVLMRVGSGRAGGQADACGVRPCRVQGVRPCRGSGRARVAGHLPTCPNPEFTCVEHANGVRIARMVPIRARFVGLARRHYWPHT